MICNYCKIDKPETEYATYWHSTQQKMRTRKECNTCFNGKKREKKKGLTYTPPQPKVIKIIQCTGCKKKKPETDFTFKPSPRAITRCDECRSKSKNYEQNKRERLKELEDTMGGLDFYKEPNTYTNEIQKKAVFDIMLSIGWHFNEETQIWYKEGIKTPQGVFINLKTYLLKNKGQFKVKITDKMVEDMKQMATDGYTYLQISQKHNITYDTIVRCIGRKKKNT